MKWEKASLYAWRWRCSDSKITPSQSNIRASNALVEEAEAEIDSDFDGRVRRNVVIEGEKRSELREQNEYCEFGGEISRLMEDAIVVAVNWSFVRSFFGYGDFAGDLICVVVKQMGIFAQVAYICISSHLFVPLLNSLIHEN